MIMEYNIFSKKLHEAFTQNGYGGLIDEDNARKLYSFACLLIETNKTHNLTAITDENGIILKHFVDCTSVCKFIPQNSSIIDVGCGAGFPSLPIAILRPDVRTISIDSTQKKVSFIEMVARELCLENIYPQTCRAEDFARKARESFDTVISRAVARMNVLAELCIPLVKVGGTFIAMKASKGDEEYEEAKIGACTLGANLINKEVSSLSFANDTIEREIFVFKKERKTPSEYPRNYSQIIKKPL